jgi:hypothetical protein
MVAVARTPACPRAVDDGRDGLVCFEAAELGWLGFQPLEAVFAVVGVAVTEIGTVLDRLNRHDLTDGAEDTLDREEPLEAPALQPDPGPGRVQHSRTGEFLVL